MGQLSRPTATEMTLHYLAMTALTAWMVLLAGFMVYVLVAA
jgi:hypothetical protein